MEKKIISTFKKTVEDRDYVISFPMDAHLQELWDFIQEVAKELIDINTRNTEALKAQEEANNAAESTESSQAVDVAIPSVQMPPVGE